MAVRNRSTPKAHIGPAAVERPSLAAEAPRFVLLEREVEGQFRPLMREALQSKLDALAESEGNKAPTCCDRPMRQHDSSQVSWSGLFGKMTARVCRFRCKLCGAERRPLLELLGVEPGRVSGTLARTLALLGTVAPYELAAELAALLLGVTVNAMTVWRAVQRLGEAASQHTDALSAYHVSSHSESAAGGTPADVVILGVDGCSLGMQVRQTRRRRKTDNEELPPLPEVKDGHFREVKTGVVLLPEHRVEPSKGRRALLRRVLVTCLGDADTIFDRLWAELHERGWLGPKTVVVITGDGAEWIWNRASMFERRCEILDFWHVMEHAWEVARLHWGEGSKQGARWMRRLAKSLRAGKVERVIARLKNMSGRDPKAQEKLDELIRYYTNNAMRMRYDEYIRLGYGIGSGAVESAHKQIVHARMRQSGMRWSETGARRLLALRLLLLNNDWALVDRLRLAPIAS